MKYTETIKDQGLEALPGGHVQKLKGILKEDNKHYMQ